MYLYRYVSTYPCIDTSMHLCTLHISLLPSLHTATSNHGRFQDTALRILGMSPLDHQPENSNDAMHEETREREGEELETHRSYNNNDKGYETDEDDKDYGVLHQEFASRAPEPLSRLPAPDLNLSNYGGGKGDEKKGSGGTQQQNMASLVKYAYGLSPTTANVATSSKLSNKKEGKLGAGRSRPSAKIPEKRGRRRDGSVRGLSF